MKASEDIFEEMKALFLEKTGVDIRTDCDMGVRMTACAAQLEALYVYNDWVMRQCFPQTAAGEYLDMHCAVMSPNLHRYSILKDLARDFAVDAVVDLTWQGCQPYDVESWSVKKFVREELGLPFLQVVTDYSGTDTEQLKVRLEAFLEMLA